jgi:SAM-dependent methyltransferase
VSAAEEPASVRRFTGLAEIYDRYRPRYPSVAIAALLTGLPQHPATVDIGAGTGISSRALAEAGARVIAVEPNDDMRGFAARSGIDARAGTAEATTLPDACADLVTSFQAFHWFANAEALAEFRRLLRPRGRIGLVWNERDMRDPFTRDFRDLEKAFGEDSMLAAINFDDTQLDPLLTAAGFEGVSWQRFENAQILGRDEFVGRVRSTSYVPRSGPALDKLVAELQELHARYADAAGNVTLRYQTEVILGTLAAK